jgi:hypothetical protein
MGYLGSSDLDLEEKKREFSGWNYWGQGGGGV